MVRTATITYTSQLYFPEAISAQVLAADPYSQRPDRDTTNETDEILPAGGEPAMLDIAANEGDHRAANLLLPGPAVGRS